MIGVVKRNVDVSMVIVFLYALVEVRRVLLSCHCACCGYCALCACTLCVVHFVHVMRVV